MIEPCATHSLRHKKLLTNDTKTLRSGNTINIVIRSNELKVAPFQFRCDRRGADLCYDRNDMKVVLLVRHEVIAPEGSNDQEINDKFLSEIVHRIQKDEDDDTNCCFLLVKYLNFQKIELILCVKPQKFIVITILPLMQ